MGLVDELATYLAGQGCGTAGTSLFGHVLPESSGLASGILETAGQPPGRVFRASLPWTEKARVQIVTRSTKPAAGATLAVPTNARSRAAKIMRTMEAVANSTSVASGRTYYRCEATGSVVGLGHDEKGRAVFSCTYDVWRQPSTAD